MHSLPEAAQRDPATRDGSSDDIGLRQRARDPRWLRTAGTAWCSHPMNDWF
jgi:hypothetical protein